jgi:hypothetical protein
VLVVYFNSFIFNPFSLSLLEVINPEHGTLNRSAQI